MENVNHVLSFCIKQEKTLQYDVLGHVCMGVTGNLTNMKQHQLSASHERVTLMLFESEPAHVLQLQEVTFRKARADCFLWVIVLRQSKS